MVVPTPIARMLAVLVSLGSLAALGPCVDEEAIREAEARRASLLADRVPKEELWALIEARGREIEALEAAKRAVAAVETRIAAIEAQKGTLDQRQEAVATEAAMAEERHEAAAASLARARAELAEVESALRALDARERARGEGA